MNKKILSITAILLFIMSLLTTNVSAATPTTGSCGENVSWSFDETTGTLTISGTGAITRKSWTNYSELITSVVVEEGITSICDNAFNLRFAEAFSFPDSLEYIGIEVIYNSKYSRDTSNYEDGLLYVGKYLVNALYLPLSVTIKDGTIGIAGQACYRVPNSNDLSTLIIPDSVKFIGERAFDGCSKLTSVTMSENVKTIENRAFAGCGIKEIVLPDTLEKLGDGAFNDCFALSEITIPAGITEIPEYLFYSCEKLSSVTLPKSITLIDEKAFSDCNSLNIVIYAGTEEQWKNITIRDSKISGVKKVFHEHGYEYVYNNDATYDADGTETGVCPCGDTDTRIKKGTKLALIDTSKLFKDVKATAWYKQYVDYAVTLELFNGVSDNTFEPNTSMTRGMFVTVLARIADVTVDNKSKTQFTDIETDRYFTGAVAWAAENGIVTGVTSTTFEPNAKITREQMCTLVVRFAKYLNITLEQTVEKTSFSDESKIKDYAKEAVVACQTAGIVNGMTETEFQPQQPATRAQVAKILSVFVQNYLNK